MRTTLSSFLSFMTQQYSADGNKTYQNTRWHTQNITIIISTTVKTSNLTSSNQNRSKYPDIPICVRTHVGWVWGMHHSTQQWSKSMETITVRIKVYYYFFNYALQPLRLTVPSGLDVPTFATRRLHACHHARAPSGRRWNCGRKMSENFA